jgi:NAD(P)-dependent dehydrogenase (short-subunit alcohol dehydrogenase family)
MERDVILVTGGNSGIGFQCALQLAREGRRVLIASRDREASVRAVREIERECGSGSASERGLDLGSLHAIRAFADEIADEPVRALVCNAGLQVNDGPRLTSDGFEITFGVNHLGHFLLVNLLLAHLAERAPARIVVVGSGVHDPDLFTGMPKAQIEDLETLAKTGGPRAGAFDGRLAYVNSKLCNLWFTYECARRIEAAGLSSDERPISVNAFEPGLVPGSGLGRDYPAPLRFVWERILPAIARGVSPFVASINTAEAAGQAMARVALDPGLASTSSLYFPSHSRWAEAASSKDSYDEERAAALWEASVKMTGLTSRESPLIR